MAEFGRPVPVVRRKISTAPLTLTLRCLPPGHGKSPGYESWLKSAAADLRGQVKARLSGRQTISIRLEDRHPRRDAGGCVPAIVDLLVVAAVLPDTGPGFVRALHCAWAPVSWVTIKIERAA